MSQNKSVNPVIIKKNRIFNANSIDLIREDIIYKATADDFLKGKFPNLILINKLNRIKHSSQTIARFSSMNSSVVVLTSDAVTRLIGQKNYDKLFVTLCSVINLQLKVEGMLSLLTEDKDSCKKVNESKETYYVKPECNIIKHEKSSQTDDSCMTLIMKEKRRKNRRCKARPYVVQDPCKIKKSTSDNSDQSKITGKGIKKFIIYPQACTPSNTANDSEIMNNVKTSSLPEIRDLVDEDSNISDSSISGFSISSANIPNDVLHPEDLLQNIDRQTANYRTIKLYDGTTVTVNDKIEDKFHLIKDNLKNMDVDTIKRLMVHQLYVDFKCCLERDEDDNLPLHSAVINNDVQLVTRLCIMLHKRNTSVDVLGGNDLTALRLSIHHNTPDCARVLLLYGADVMLVDDEGNTPFHEAARRDRTHLAVLIEHCRKYARPILKENEDLWKEDMDEKSNGELADWLLRRISVLCNTAGYTPLMLASELGLHENVKSLIKIAPDTINKPMPNSGNTALYLAVASACFDADEHGNRSKVADHFLKTIELLIVNGADPFAENCANTSVNDLLSEFNIRALSLLIANKITSVRFFSGNEAKDFDSYMLVKSNNGEVNVQEMIRSDRNVTKNNTTHESNDDKTKNIVIKEDIIIKSENITSGLSPKEPVLFAKRVTNTINKRSNNKLSTKKPIKVDSVPIIRKLILTKKIETDPLAMDKTEVSKAQNLNNPGQVKFLKIINKDGLQTVKRISDINIGASTSKKGKHS